MKNANKKTKIIVSIICIVIFICVSCAIVSLNFPVFYDNKIVDIELNEYTIDNNGQKVKCHEIKNVIPGEKISKVIEITCKPGSADCYIRTKININNKNEELTENENLITIKNLDIDKTKWLYCNQDGYWYYNLKLTQDSNSAILFTKIDMPLKINNMFALEEFEINVTVESIQAKNFTPNFNEDSKNPWFGINENDIKKF